MRQSERFNFYRNLYHSYTQDTPMILATELDVVFFNRHKLLPIINHVVKEQMLQKKIGLKTFELINSYCLYNSNKRSILINEMKKIVSTFNDEGIRYAIRKGVSLSKIYKEDHHRSFNDIDFLVERENSERVSNVLKELGFKCGFYLHQERIIKEHKPETILKYKISPDHLPHFTKVVDEIPVVVDIAFLLGWTSDSQGDKVTKRNLCDSIENDGYSFLSEEDNYKHTLLHLFRESFFKSSLIVRPPYLSSFFDVLLLNGKEYKFDINDSHVQYISKVNYIANLLVDNHISYPDLLKHCNEIMHRGLLSPAKASLFEIIFCNGFEYKNLINAK